MLLFKKLYNMDLRLMNFFIGFFLQLFFFFVEDFSVCDGKKKVNEKIIGVKKSFMKYILIKIFFGYYSKGNLCL